MVLIRRRRLLVLPEAERCRRRPNNKKETIKTKKDKCRDVKKRESFLLQMGDKTSETVIDFPSGFPQKDHGFPQWIRMWKTHYARKTPHAVFHINEVSQAKSRLFMWKTMWKLWKSMLVFLA